jgi:hypothetical protein
VNQDNFESGAFSMRNILMLLLAFTLMACSYIAPLDPETAKSRMPFLVEGKTSKEEVLTRLGDPANQYEDGRIVTYVMSEDLNSRFHVGQTGPTRSLKSAVYNLVLVFGESAVLERFSIVRVR